MDLFENEEAEPHAPRGLSLLQPYLHMITHAPMRLAKRIENRTWRTMTWKEWPKQELYLHASKQEKRAYREEAIRGVYQAIPELRPWLDSLDHTTFARGGITSRVRVIGMVTPSGELRLEKGATPSWPIDMRWHIPGQWGYVLDDVRITPFAECAGSRGFWTVPKAAQQMLAGGP